VWLYWFIAAALLPASSAAVQLLWPWLGYLAPWEAPGALCCVLAGRDRRRQLVKILRRRQQAARRPVPSRPARELPARRPVPPAPPTRLLRRAVPDFPALEHRPPPVQLSGWSSPARRSLPDGSFPVASREDWERLREHMALGMTSAAEARERIARLGRVHGA